MRIESGVFFVRGEYYCAIGMLIDDVGGCCDEVGVLRYECFGEDRGGCVIELGMLIDGFDGYLMDVQMFVFCECAKNSMMFV